MKPNNPLKRRKESAFIAMNIFDELSAYKNEQFKFIRNTNSSKTNNLRIEDNQEFYEEFISKLKEEETNSHSSIVKERKFSPHTSNIKKTKNSNSKNKNSSRHHPPHSPNLDLNHMVMKVFDTDSTQDRSKIQSKANKISVILQPLYDTKTISKENKIKTSKTYKPKQTNNNNNITRYKLKEKIIDKEKSFWKKVMCCLHT